MAQEAFDAHIECMREVGQMIPEASSLDEVMADPENAEAIPFLVAISNRREQGVQVSLTIPEGDLRKVDALAKKQGKSRSAVLMEAARRMIAASEDHAA